MIIVPDRLKNVAESLEQGKPIDYQKVAMLQAIDVALLDRMYVDESITNNEEDDDKLAREHGERTS